MAASAGPTASSAPAQPQSASAPETDACLHQEGPDAFRLPYPAFGPSAMAYEVIGQGWWQWDGEGHDFDDDRDTIWVVVHDNVELAALDLRFPVREAERCDYRYLALETARAYLAAHIDELETDPDLKAMHDRLVATSTRIEEHFSIE